MLLSMDINKLNEIMRKEGYLTYNPNISQYMDKMVERARHIINHTNVHPYNMKHIRKLFSKLIGKKVDESFRLFPPYILILV